MNHEIDYFTAGPDTETNKKVSAKTSKMHDGYSDEFMGIGYFKGIFSLLIKDDVKPYQASPKHIAYALQEPFKNN